MSRELFNSGFVGEFLENRKREARDGIERYNGEAILVEPEDALIERLTEEYTLKSPRLHSDQKYFPSQPSEVVVPTQSRDVFGDVGMVNKKRFRFTVCIPFEGDFILFNYYPTSYSRLVGRQMNAEANATEVVLDYNEEVNDASQIEKLINEDIALIERNLLNLERDVATYNDAVRGMVREKVATRRKDAATSQSIVNSLSIPIRRRDNVPATYNIPEVRRRPAIAPAVAPKTAKPEPTLATEEYEHILTIIKDMSFAMERSPHTFSKLKEEEIRDFFLILLNGHYQGNATSETFNGSGKTDILIRYQNANAFVAECKFWKGKKQLLNTISQLFGYVTWRDTKTAVILFHRGGDLTAVLSQIEPIIKSHPNYKSTHTLRDAELKSNTTFSYKFTHPTDSDKEIILSVLVYEVPIKKAAREKSGGRKVKS